MMAKRLAVWTALALFLCGCTGLSEAPAPDLVAGPYVNNVSESTAKVLWVARPDVEAGISLLADGRQLGAGPKMDVSITPITDTRNVLHTAAFSGLAPGRTYRYVLRCGREEVEGLIHTAPAPDFSGPIRFAVYGDNRSDPERHRAVIERMRKDLPLDFVINTGDLVTSGMTWREWPEEFFGPGRDLFNVATLWPVRGNHEGPAVIYRDVFDLPNNELFYGFDYGSVHVVVLDNYYYPETADPAEAEERNLRRADPEMLAWLERDLAATKAEWKIVVYHTPTFNIGGHGSRWGQEDVLPVLEKYGVDVCAYGHSHIYERFRPIGPKGGKPIIHIVTGGGGAPTYDVQRSPILAKAYAGLNSCLVTVEGNRLDIVAKTPDGAVLDRMTLVKTGDRFQDDVMAAAIPTSDAKRSAYLESARLWADFSDTPSADIPVPVTFAPDNPLPVGAVVRVSTAKDGAWRIQPAEFTVAAPADAEQPDEPTMDLGIETMAVAPHGVEIEPGRVSPPLRVAVSITYLGQTYARDSVPVVLSENTIRMFTPEPVPARVPRLPGPVTIDGDLADWKGVAPLVVPSTGAESRITKLGWSDKGLCVAMLVPDDHIEIKPGKPWVADSVEVFIEPDYARSFDARKSECAQKFLVYALPESGPGTAGVEISYGPYEEDPGVIRAAWRPVEGGYTLEFLVPRDALSPAAMADGTRMGFNYILRNNGKTMEEFVKAAGKASAWRKPLFWGAVLLTGRQ